MTTIRLAAWHGGKTMRATFAAEKFRASILASFVDLKHFIPALEVIKIRDWVLDSGAFSAHNSGVEITVEDFTAQAKQLLASQPLLKEVFVLDVIGDWKASLKNAEYMWRHGVEAIPTFHMGEPWDVLLGLCRDYPKVALGGSVGVAKKLPWIEECFAKVWPKKLHGFGIANENVLVRVPFHSVDATNWAYAPSMGGFWRGMSPKTDKMHMVPLRTSRPYNLGPEVLRFLKLEKKIQFLWRKEMAELG